jgi:hypothetical protein
MALLIDSQNINKKKNPIFNSAHTFNNLIFIKSAVLTVYEMDHKFKIFVQNSRT